VFCWRVLRDGCTGDAEAVTPSIDNPPTLTPDYEPRLGPDHRTFYSSSDRGGSGALPPHARQPRRTSSG